MLEKDIKIYYADIDSETNTINGFYCKDIHGDNIPTNCIAIDEELWQHLLGQSQVEVDIDSLASIPSALEEEIVYNINHKDFFTKVVIPSENIPSEPTELELLKAEVEELKTLVHSLREVK